MRLRAVILITGGPRSWLPSSRGSRVFSMTAIAIAKATTSAFSNYPGSGLVTPAGVLVSLKGTQSFQLCQVWVSDCCQGSRVPHRMHHDLNPSAPSRSRLVVQYLLQGFSCFFLSILETAQAGSPILEDSIMAHCAPLRAGIFGKGARAPDSRDLLPLPCGRGSRDS